MSKRKFAVGDIGIIQNICPCFSLIAGREAVVLDILDDLPWPFGTWTDHCGNERCYMIQVDGAAITIDCGDIHLKKKEPPLPATTGEDKIMDLLKNPIDEIIHFLRR